MGEMTTKDKEREQRRRTMILGATTIIAFSQLGAMCLPKPPPPPVHAMLPVPALMMHDGQTEMAHDGVTVTVTPIDGSNFQDFPQVYKKLTWQEPVKMADGTVQQVDREANWSIVPIPAFQVRVVNDTGHVIRFTRAVFRLQDNTGKSYQTFASTAELLAWNQAALSRSSSGTNALAQANMMTQISPAVGGLQLVTRNIELLKGDQWSGYLVFNLGGTGYQDLMNSVERLTLRLAEIPVETDDAGNTTRATEFTFVVDKTSKEIEATCPGGTKEPSWQAGCKPER